VLKGNSCVFLRSMEMFAMTGGNVVKSAVGISELLALSVVVWLVGAEIGFETTIISSVAINAKVATLTILKMRS